MDEFVVLRDLNAHVRAGIGFESGAAAPPRPDLGVETLGNSDIRELQRDPTVIEIARSIPIHLIEPFEAEAADHAGGGGGTTWGIEAVRADRSGFSGRGIKVAVLDTGIDADHPAFAGVDLVQQDFTGEGNGDGNGHGTHCAGTVFGRDVDGLRIGVARGVNQALIGKVLGGDGGGSSKMLFDAMFWAASQGARVISMSVGFDFPGLGKRLIDQGFPADLATSVALESYRKNIRVFDAILDLLRAQAQFTGGTVVVAASGNESQRDRDPDHEVSASLPAAAFGVISVGALAKLQNGFGVAAFSNTNPVLSAPGVGVVSAAVGGGLRPLSGTSMACPHVAGLTALWWEALQARSIPVTGDTVAAQLRAAAKTDVFVRGTDITDRGEGLAQAPA